MARPKKCRKVCGLPSVEGFAPQGEAGLAGEAITMVVEEYETIRLIDYENLTQEECSRYMHIARTTVQQIYNDARKKMAAAIVEGRPLIIGGGDYRLCDGKADMCGAGSCVQLDRK